MSDARAKSLPNVLRWTAELGYPEACLEPDLDRALRQCRHAAAGARPAQPRAGADHRGAGFVSRFEAAGYEIKTSTPQELGSFAAETVRWGQIIKDLKIQVE